MSFTLHSNKRLYFLYFLYLHQDSLNSVHYINSVNRFYILHFFSVFYIIQTSIPICTMSRYIYLYQQTSMYYALRSCFVTHGFNFNKTFVRVYKM